MTNRRNFLKNTAFTATGLSLGTFMACNDSQTSQSDTKKVDVSTEVPELKISLAQWSLHRVLESNEIDARNFAQIAKNDYGINAIEYVNGFYRPQVKNESFWQEMLQRSKNVDVKNLLIMVDEEGDLGHLEDAERKKSVENHYKWVDAAKILGCHSIRVNAFGEGEKDAVKAALVDGMSRLCEYAAKENINVLIENHGLYSSDGQFIVDVIKTANQPNFGTLPDFGNWCLNQQWGSTKNNQCTEVYGIYKGVSDFLPYAKGYSAKSYEFDENGNETTIDYQKMIQLAKDASYDGYIGIEYEGEAMSEADGIRATKALIEKAWKEVYS